MGKTMKEKFIKENERWLKDKFSGKRKKRNLPENWNAFINKQK